MDPGFGLLLLVVVASVSVVVVGWGRRRRTRRVVLRIDVGRDPEVPLMVVNAGRDPVFELEATLRFDPREPRPGYVMERHRRTRVLLPGERVVFPLPEDVAGSQAIQLATLVHRVRLDAVGRDARGRPVATRDVLDDPLAWLETQRRSQPSAARVGPPPSRE